MDLNLQNPKEKDIKISIQKDRYISTGGHMGNVMISLDDEHEALLRKLAQKKHGGKKGSLSNVVKEALEEVKESKDDVFRREFLDFLRTGVKGKYKMYKSRDELYD